MSKNIPEYFRSRVVMALQGTGSAADDYVLPTPGASKITMRVLATMGNSEDLALTLKYANDASGTEATAFADVPLYVNGVRQDTDSETYTIEDETGNFIVDFVIDPALIPADKYIGMSYASSNSDNLMCCEIIEDVAYKPTET
jgi:hypothetical protein